ncbi:hypothetical protein M9R32_07890 [Paenisporosarcina quisquiliarum]|uniref:Lipoprotein n=1 Tax=Paenisporosarcina quisquiliarum TaxID=365346 RepID=A0A9X3LFJ6_9BACL|nr:hypothetical protein [Paenisporosarcina quisquiliarum]MCZ8537095.1 hypothetical protein [Paenisporosarcina quisquiliarum]
MKYLTLGILMVFLLSACSGESKSGDAEIKRSELTNFEENLLSLSSQHSMVYDLELKNEAAKEIVVTIDYYEKGKFVRQITELTDRIVENQDSLRLAVLQQVNKNEDNWITSIMNESGMSSVAFPQPTDERERMNLGSTSGGIELGALVIGERKIIYSIAYSSSDEMSILQNIETKEDLKKATNYEQVYIVSVELRYVQ